MNAANEDIGSESESESDEEGTKGIYCTSIIVCDCTVTECHLHCIARIAS